MSTFPTEEKQRRVRLSNVRSSSSSHHCTLRGFPRRWNRNEQWDCTDCDIDREYENWEFSFSIDAQHQCEIPVNRNRHYSVCE